MATYFHGNTSDIQSSADGLQTLYLMNPTYVPYPDAPQHSTTPNMLLVNSNATTPSNALNLANFPHAPQVPPSPNQQQQHHLIHGVTNILGSTNSDNHNRPPFLGHPEINAFHGFSSAAAAPRVHYNLWGQVIEQPSSAAATTSRSSGDGGAGFRQPSQQGLSLSLSSQQTAYTSLSGELDLQGHAQVAGIGNSPSSVSNGVSSVNGVLLGSKFFKAAQELLDEVVNVGKGIYKDDKFAEGENKEKMKAKRESSSGVGDCSSGEGENSANKQVAELSTAQRQELQMKKSKLITMLDEVEQRYRQYHHQMQIVISSFEQAAGFGAAKSYTALALKTISKQFRSLKDAISSQIRATSMTLGEDEFFGVKVEGSKLRYVDHHLRQQRALQQLGMIQPNAWRPQRGLPERAVSILRAWLFEHFLHPYPKDSDKVMLAKQTGLARRTNIYFLMQVSNWFINARVRLWKPMVEEMYLEEIKEQEDTNVSDNIRSEELGSTTNVTQESGAIKVDQIKVLQSKQESFNNRNTSPTEISTNSSMSTSPMRGSFQSHSGFHHMQSHPNKPRSSEMQNSPSSFLSVDMEMKQGDTNREANTKFGIERHNRDGYPLMTGNTNHGGGFGAFSMEDIGSRFNVTEQLASRFHGNGVSLTLGLPHNENLPISGTQHGFLSQNIHLGRRLEMGTNGNEFCAINTQPSSHSGTSYESIDIQNRKRFASQLLPDFVA
ncbi:BEL1-like homeodomain protein 1 [Gastrolobium bilobum]|uniref:BEL1-like homeodomain protein 1 n=1 Tax=Gastrolobium bilobum TaxID=150636 RepID=UPI002AB175D7|nr:BEL1-like homeodomain protein 1 [Gastrolobium bilobum]